MAKGIDGIFDHLFDKAAFIDKLEVSIRGKRRKQILKLLRIRRTMAIGGGKRIFARASHGQCSATGNNFQLKFGVMRRFPNVPDFAVVLYTNQTPITLAHVVLVLNSLFRAGYRVTVSRLELTFDLTDTSVNFFIRRVMSRAKRRKKIETTFYVGCRMSGWQVCIYQKTPTLTRFEFKLRSAELRKLGVKYPSDIIHLRNAALFGRLVSICEIDRSMLPKCTDLDDPGEARARAIASWATSFTSRRFERAMKRSGNWRKGMLRPCPTDAKLRQMQLRLVW